MQQNNKRLLSAQRMPSPIQPQHPSAPSHFGGNLAVNCKTNVRETIATLKQHLSPLSRPRHF
jgi:hypothetical protein